MTIYNGVELTDIESRQSNLSAEPKSTYEAATYSYDDSIKGNYADAYDEEKEEEIEVEICQHQYEDEKPVGPYADEE